MSDVKDDAADRAAQKKLALEKALEHGRTQVRLDARRAGVRLPAQFEGESMLALNLSWRFPHTEMVINERGFAATLRFNREPFRCVVPWSALFALVPGEGDPLVWPADVPTEFGGPARTEDERDPPPVEPTRPRLSVVEGGARPAPAAEPVSPVLESIAREDDLVEPDDRPDPEPPRPTAARPPWLKLVQ